MKLLRILSQADVDKVRELLVRMQALPRFQERMARQERMRNGSLTHAKLWRALVSAQLTSAQKSGDDSYVRHLLDMKPFPLAYDAVKQSANPRVFVTNILTEHGGIRFANKIGKHLAEILRELEQGGWAPVFEQCKRLRRGASPATERAVANYFRKSFIGVGPKQSRNLLQSLGLIQYEIPIDSRLLKWLLSSGFPPICGPAALQDAMFYEFMLKTVQALCAKAGVLPTEFDAAVFIDADLQAANRQ